MSYNRKRIRTWNAAEGTLSSYSWGIDEYALRALTWDVRGNILSIGKGSSDSPYTNTYTYDGRNRLKSETNGAKVSVKSSSLTGASYRHAQNDVSGKADGSLSSDAVRLDYNAASVIIDLGSDREITSLNIYGRNNRIDPQYLEVWTKKGNSENWEMTPESSLSWNKTTEGWYVYFVGGKTAEEIKLHSTWDERDADYNAVDKSTFSALIKNIFEVSFTAEGKTSSWTYDAKGNRLSETESCAALSSKYSSITYYPNTDLIKTYGDWKFNYDRNGSLTSRGKTAAETPSEEEPFASWNFDAESGEVWYYEYDMSGRMTKSSSSKKGTEGLTERASYAYDWRGLLVKKTYAEFTADEGVSITGGSTASVTEWYEYTQDGRLLYTEKSSGSEVKKTDYIWAETTLWCEVDDGEVYYHHTDHLGTTEAVTDSTGNIVWHAEYEAFGSVLSENGSRTFTPSFTGKMLDECSGLYYFNARWYDSECGRFTSQDPARDGVNWYGYCGQNPVTFIDPNGLETWRNSTLTREEYDKNYQLQRQYSWEQIQQHFSDNPNGIIYRYDTISYSLGTSNRDIPNMEKPSAELAWGLASLSKLAGSKIMSWIKNGITSAFASGVVDTSKQLTNMVKDENRTFDTNELFNATIGGGVAGFVTGGVASIPGGGSLSESIMLSNVVGGFSGSMTSQLLYNVQNGESLTNGMGAAYMYGAAGGLMVGGINICFPSLLPSNIGQVLRDSVRDEIVNAGTSQVIEEKINETRNN